MAKVILRRRKRLSKEVPPHLDVALRRLARVNGLLTAAAFCADEGAELDLGPVCIAARDAVDRVIEDLAKAGMT